MSLATTPSPSRNSPSGSDSPSASVFVTCAHCVPEADGVSVGLRSSEGRLTWYDAIVLFRGTDLLDLAVLAVNQRRPLAFQWNAHVESAFAGKKYGQFVDLIHVFHLYDRCNWYW